MKIHFKFYFENDRANIALCFNPDVKSKELTSDKSIVTCENCKKILKKGYIKYFKDKAGKEIKVKL